MGYHHTLSVFYSVDDHPLADRLNHGLDGRHGFLGGRFAEPEGQSRLGYACHAVFSHFDLAEFLAELRVILADPEHCWVAYYCEHWGTDRPVLFRSDASEAEVYALATRAPMPWANREAGLLAALRRVTAPAFYRSLEECQAETQALIDAYLKDRG